MRRPASIVTSQGLAAFAQASAYLAWKAQQARAQTTYSGVLEWLAGRSASLSANRAAMLLLSRVAFWAGVVVTNTLESLLGIQSNGYSLPDFHGWEVKARSVGNSDKPGSSVVTLFTPEPTSGAYVDEHFSEFMNACVGCAFASAQRSHRCCGVAAAF